MSRAPILIGLNGVKRSGKDTIAKYIIHWGENRGVEVIASGFADLLKLSAARSLGLATNMNDAIVLMDSLKEYGSIEISIPDQSLSRAITGREFLKWYGTEGHRDVFGDDFWVDQLFPPGNPWANFEVWKPYIIVITDCRFANEARRIRGLAGSVWHINRQVVNEEDQHLSEQPLPRELIDKEIDNNSSLEALEINISEEMNSYHIDLVHMND